MNLYKDSVENIDPAGKRTQIAYKCIQDGRAVKSARSMGGVGRLRPGGFDGPTLGLVSCAGASDGGLMTHEGNTAFSAMRSNFKV